MRPPLIRPTFLGLLGQDSACARSGALGHVDDVLAFHLSCYAATLHYRQTVPLVSWLAYN